jgi:hypothetical protein
MKLKSIQCIWIQFKNWIQLNSTIELIQIQLKINGMQIGGECIEYLLMNMVLEKEF